MKKIILVVLICCVFLTGCGRYSKSGIVKELNKKFDKSNGYKLTGELSIVNNDENYNYDVEVCYKKKDNYKVTLTNTSNDHTQIILKNSDGVYVLTPALNKSFKFQSNWPYNNSQIYLIDALIHDINEDKELSFKKTDDKYIINTKVKYPNNSKLTYQKLVISNDLELEKVSVYNSDGVEVMTMKFDKISYSPKFKSDEFDIDNIISKDDTVKETGSLDDIIYPLFLPNGTKLVNEDVIDKNNGKRVIMNYDGEKSFVLVEETADVFNEFTVIPTIGEPYPLMDVLGVMTDNSLSWTSGGVEFYLISDVMSKDEMIEVAESITGIVSMK